MKKQVFANILHPGTFSQSFLPFASLAALTLLPSCARPKAVSKPGPTIIEQDRYDIELLRLHGEDPGLGQFSDIVYQGEDRFLICAGWGMFEAEADGDHGFRVVSTTRFDPPPRSKVPGAKRLVDIDADGRQEAVTKAGGLGFGTILYDDDGTEHWRVSTPHSGYPDLTGLYAVQADGDPELELIEISSVFSNARLIQADGIAGELIDLPYHSTYHLVPIDVNGDGVDELLGAFSKHVVLWSFKDGVLADLDLKTGRAISFSPVVGSSLDTDQSLRFAMSRFGVESRPGPRKRHYTGVSILTLSRSNDGWTLEESPMEPEALATGALVGAFPQSAHRSTHPTLWMMATAFWTVVTVGDTKLGLLYRERLRTSLGEHTVSDGAAAVNPDSPAALEAWVVWMDGIWRVRVTERESHAQLVD